MEQALRELVARVAEVPSDFAPDAHLRDDLEIDSFKAAELVFEIERIFATKVPDEQFVQAQTFNEVLTLLTSLAA